MPELGGVEGKAGRRAAYWIFGRRGVPGGGGRRRNSPMMVALGRESKVSVGDLMFQAFTRIGSAAKIGSGCSNTGHASLVREVLHGRCCAAPPQRIFFPPPPPPPRSP